MSGWVSQLSQIIKIKYKNNIEAFIHASWLHPLKKRRIVIVGSERMIIFDDMAENKVSLYNKSVKINNNINPSGTSFDFDYLDNGIEYPTINWQEPLKVETNHFIDCILKGNPCLTDASHAMKVVKILSTKNSWLMKILLHDYLYSGLTKEFYSNHNVKNLSYD